MSSEIAALERVEIEAWRSMFEAAPRPFAEAMGLKAELWDDALFTIARGIDAGQFNRLQLPSGTPEDGKVARAVSLYREVGLRRFLVQIAPGPFAGEARSQAEAAGLVPFRRAWAKFRRSAHPVEPVRTDLNIALASTWAEGAFGQTVVEGFGMPAATVSWFSALVGAPGWKAFVSWDGERPVGGGAMYLGAAGGAWIGVGSTIPDARGRGSQSAILAHRIEAAIRAGASFIVTETGTSVPGEPQASFNNISRAGFEIAYDRPNWTEKT